MDDRNGEESRRSGGSCYKAEHNRSGLRIAYNDSRHSIVCREDLIRCERTICRMFILMSRSIPYQTACLTLGHTVRPVVSLALLGSMFSLKTG